MISIKALVILVLAILGVSLRSVRGFAPPTTLSPTSVRSLSSSKTVLAERRWNFNDGQGPWGMKKNAEIWNGRVAQMAFVAVLLQEIIQGKGVVQGLQEGDFLNVACVASFAFVVVALTALLAIKGDDDYVSRDLGRK